MKAIVFGGGKIARGFIGHLLYLNDVPFTFVDMKEDLVTLINRRQKYRVHVMGNSSRDTEVTGCRAIPLSDIQRLAKIWSESDIAFTAVGGKNLQALGKALAKAFSLWPANTEREMTIVTCENWKDPASEFQTAILSHLDVASATAFCQQIGVTEAVVMRSGVEPPTEMQIDDPLCVCVSDYWELPVDVSRVKGRPVPIEGIRYIDQFSGFLERKFYTYNAANGTVSYLGYLRRHKLLADTAHDLHIIPILDLVYEETGWALANKYNLPIEDQRTFALSSKKKLQDRNIVDFVERNARDPIRKLGPNDRLVGAARLVMNQGITPHGLATAIAAALHYDEPSDPIAQELRRMRETRGIDYVLETVCKLSPGDKLARLVHAKVEYLRTQGWLQTRGSV